MKYRSVVFIQGDESDEPFRILHNSGEDALLEYLMQWEYGETGEVYSDIPWGTYDVTCFFNIDDLEYCVAYNWNLSYVSLTEVIHD
ncbi:MAG TPA: hypothetical protein VIY48_12995 [Candidatus Paceibacterota bacterium]